MIRALILLVVFLPVAAADEKPDADSEVKTVSEEADAVTSTQRSTREPSRNAEDLLRRFVAECVTIQPGSKNFPADAVIGAEDPADHEVARRTVQLTTPFRISRYEVTQELYQHVMGHNPSRWQGRRNSAEMMSFTEAQQFTQKLTTELRRRKLIDDHQVVRLPTSVEWEYCCRAGSTTRYCFGDDVSLPDSPTGRLDQFAWHTGNAAGNDPAVGVLKPNPWGLYDVHGYLWEFVHDDPATSAGVSIDAAATEEPANKDETDKSADATCKVRGGSWRDPYPRLSSSSYLTVSRDFRSDAVGFRCVIAANDHGKKSVAK